MFLMYDFFMNQSILIVDESQEAANLLKDVLESSGFGYQCWIVRSIDGVVPLLMSRKIQIVLIDSALCDERKYQKLKKIRLVHHQIRILMLATEMDARQMQLAKDYHIDQFCLKEDDYPALIDSIEQVI